MAGDGANCTLLNVIQGYRKPLMKKTPLYFSNSLDHSLQTPESKEITATIKDLMKMNVLEIAPHTPSFISRMFHVAKPDGTYRPIFNLRNLNKYVHSSSSTCKRSQVFCKNRIGWPNSIYQMPTSIYRLFNRTDAFFG